MLSAPSPRASARGFTLLEAIVAVAIIGLALVPLVSYISQAANELEHAADSNEQSLAMQNALALMEPINPMDEPQGRLPIDDATLVTWSSDIAVKPPDGTLIGGGLSSYRIAFYTVHITVARGDGTPWFAFDMRKVGYGRGSATGFQLGLPPG